MRYKPGDSVLIKDPKSEKDKYDEYVNKTGVIIEIFKEPRSGVWDDFPLYDCIVLVDGDLFNRRRFPFTELELIKEEERKIKSYDLRDCYDSVLKGIVANEQTDIQQKLYKTDAIIELERRKKNNITVRYNDSYDFY